MAEFMTLPLILIFFILNELEQDLETKDSFIVPCKDLRLTVKKGFEQNNHSTIQQLFFLIFATV